MDNCRAALLRLISNALFSCDIGKLPADVHLDSVMELAKYHGVLTMMMSGICGRDLREICITDKVRERLDKIARTQSAVLGLLDDAGIRSLILKGLGLAALYPDRYFRTIGDIDILVDSENIHSASRLLAENGYTDRCSDNGFHRTFTSPDGVEIELHYAVSRFDDTGNGRRLKAFFDDTLDTAVLCEFGGQTFSVPDTARQAVSLALHMKKHLIFGGLALRQICDWAVFAASLDDGVMAVTILKLMEQFGLAPFVSAVTECCVRYLGLSPEKGILKHGIDKSPDGVSGTLCEELMDNILDGGISGSRDTENEYARNFTVHGYETVTGKSCTRLLFGNLNDVARAAVPVCRKAPVLLPLGWIFVVLRRIVRRITGKRGRLSYKGAVKAADKCIAMYRALGLTD